MVRALIGGLLVSLCASLLGVSLVLKRYSMIGDGYPMFRSDPFRSHWRQAGRL